ncbi:hypothetical protein Trydic_g12075 [Trypoxylus dichotomus]
MVLQSGYLGGLRSSLGGWTQKVKSWYWGRPLENGAAYCAGGLEVGQLILQVDGTRVEGLQHQDVARLIAESFARRDREDIEFLVVEAKKSNLEPKPTALIFLEA